MLHSTRLRRDPAHFRGDGQRTCATPARPTHATLQPALASPPIAHFAFHRRSIAHLPHTTLTFRPFLQRNFRKW